MTRAILATENLTAEVLNAISGFHPEVVKEVMTAVAANKVVVVGMAQNPFVQKTQKAFKAAGIQFKYLEYGNYLKGWKPRLAIKLWSGWPTYPQVFVDGKLVGGFNETKKLLQDGKIAK